MTLPQQQTLPLCSSTLHAVADVQALDMGEPCPDLTDVDQGDRDASASGDEHDLLIDPSAYLLTAIPDICGYPFEEFIDGKGQRAPDL